MTSDDMPIVKPNIENIVKKTGITKYFFFENVFDSFLQRAVSAPVDVIIWNAPPIINMNVRIGAESTIPVYIATGILSGLIGFEAIV